MNTERFNQTLGSERFNLIDSPVNIDEEIDLLLQTHSHSSPRLRIDGRRHTLSVDIAVEQFRRYIGMRAPQQSIDEIAEEYYGSSTSQGRRNYLLAVVERNIKGVAQLLNYNPRRVLV